MLYSLTTVSIRKGQTLMVPIVAMNRAKWIWGEDAAEFRSVDGSCEEPIIDLWLILHIDQTVGHRHPRQLWRFQGFGAT